jgi:spermidine synthase
LVFILFFGSGMAGLIYEVVWSRHLTYRFGATLDAVTAILVAFMGGLALGAWLLGRVADRSRRPLALYGGLEILIGASALALPWLLEVVSPIYRAIVNSGAVDDFLARRLLRFSLTILLLLIPTTAMGATLPALSRFLARRGERLGLNVGGLYALNTLGAVAGAFLAGFFLIENLGVSQTLLLAAGLNVLAGCIAIGLSFGLNEADDFAPEERLSRREAKRRQKAARQSARQAAKLALARGEAVAPTARHATLTAWVYAISGFVALAFQVVWFRALVFNFQVLRNTTYSFSAMLTVFLIGVAAGSMLMTPVADRIKRPYLAFGVLEALIGLCGLYSFAAVYHDFPDMTIRGGMPPWIQSVQYLFIKTGGAIFPATFCMGLLFPIAVRCYVGGAKEVGADVGRLYACNTVGAIFGAFGATFILTPLLGAGWSIVFLASINLLLGAVMFLRAAEVSFRTRALLAFGCAAAALLFAGLFAPSEYPIRLHRLYGTSRLVFSGDGPLDASPDKPLRVEGARVTSSMLYYADGPMGTVSVVETVPPWRVVYVDNTGVAGTAPVMLTDQKSLAHVPTLFVPNPRRALTVGFGSGGASYSFATYPQYEEIHCVEIDPTVPRASATLTASNWGFVAPKYRYPDGSERVPIPPDAQARLESEGKTHSKPLPEIWDWLPAERDFRPTEEEAQAWAAEGYVVPWEDRRPPEGSELMGYFAADDRYRLILDDAREWLQSTDTVYDIIATDCTDLSYKTNANLYDLEYFRACRDRIADDGLVVVWMPLGNLTVEMFQVALRTFSTAFPKMGVWFMNNEPTHYCLLLGWKNDLRIDLAKLEERLAIPAVKRDLAELNLDSAEKILSCFIADHRTLQSWWGKGPLNTADDPVLEFEVPKHLYTHNQIVDNLGGMVDRANDVMDHVTGSPEAVAAMRTKLRAWEEAEKHILEGHRFQRLGQDERACEEYLKARVVCPEDKSVMALLDFPHLKHLADLSRLPKYALSLGKLYALQGRDQEALAYLNRLVYAEPVGLKSWPKKAAEDWTGWREEAIREAGAVHRRMGQPEEAAQVLALLDKPQK